MTQPLRESQAAVAFIRDWREGRSRYLCQWSESWHAMHFIGGHREPGESFRDCALREIEEELLLSQEQFSVSLQPMALLEYSTFSQSAKVDTWYTLAVFPTSLLPGSLRLAESDPQNCWIDFSDVASGTTVDGRAISPTVKLILTKLKLFPTE